MKLRKLPTDLRKLAWQRALEQGCELKYDRARSWCLKNLFIFKNTPEGHEFWAKLEYGTTVVMSEASKSLIKKVFTEAITQLKSTGSSFGFICNIIILLLQSESITGAEFKIVMNYFESNRPSDTLHTEFTLHPSWRGENAWWCTVEKEQRIKFLQKLIKQL